MRIAKLGLTALVAIVSVASAGLPELVVQVEDQAKLLTPLAADVQLESSGPDGTRSDRGVLLVRNRSDGKPGTETYLELAGSRHRLLILAEREAHVFDGTRSRKVGL